MTRAVGGDVHDVAVYLCPADKSSMKALPSPASHENTPPGYFRGNTTGSPTDRRRSKKT